MTQLLAIVVLVILGIGLALADPLNNGPKGMSAGLLNHSTASAYMYNGTSGGKTTYTVWCVDVGGVGCEKDVATESKPGVVLMGGGTDTDEAFLWQIEKAHGGDFVVLRASGDDAYNQWILDMSVAASMKLNSVRTILFKSAEASSDPVVLDIIRNAEAIFFAGGDQSDYTTLWPGTEVQRIVQSKLVNTSVGGTSAGCAIEGNWIYTGEKGSATSDAALQDPYYRYMTFAPAFLNIPWLETAITDTHFVTRDRMGRMLAFTARILKDQMYATAGAQISLVRAIGIDEHTALLMEPTTGDAITVGFGTAYACSASHVPEVCEAKTALTFSDIRCMRLDAAKRDSYSFALNTGSGVSYTNTISNGVLSANQYGPK